MDEIEIVHRIGKLVEDEHALERAHAVAVMPRVSPTSNSGTITRLR